MFYFDDWRASAEHLDDSTFGQLVKAAIQFAETGSHPEGLSAMAQFAFDIVRPRIVKDGERYGHIVDKRKYGTFCREFRKDHPDEDPPIFEEWVKSRDTTDDHMTSSDNSCYPVTTATASTALTTTTESSSTTEGVTTATASPATTNTADKPHRARSKFVPPSVDEVRIYCQERGNGIDPEHFVDYYETRGWAVGKNSMKDWKAAVRTWEGREKTHKGPGSDMGAEAYQTPETMERMNRDMERLEAIYKKAKSADERWNLPGVDDLGG
jgi:hypothetical protein